MLDTIDALAEHFDSLTHFTPTQDQRKAMARTGTAMPGGSFFIRNRDDLSNAISAVGRATPNASESETARRNSVRRHIMGRARALKLTNMIPDTWNSDGSLKQSAIPTVEDFMAAYGIKGMKFQPFNTIEDFLEHFGVRGMHWGVHRSRSSRSAAARGKASSHKAPTVSADAARAMTLRRTVKTQGTNALSNADLQTLVTRMNLESQHGKLNVQNVSAGRKFVTGLLRDVGKQQATSLAAQYGPKGAAWVAKKIAKKAVVAAAPVAAGLAVSALL